MITRTHENETPEWQKLLASAIFDPQELLEILELDKSLLLQAHAASQDFALRVPRGFVARMRKGDINDPLLRQVLPIGDELKDVRGFVHDPLQEKKANKIPGLLHKYHGRVLLIVAGACAINCRYCFRRHFPYHMNNPGTLGWQKAIDYISLDNSITEVILSGGDPLLLKDKPLADLAQKIAKIPHVRRLRIHSRLPIVLPERIDDEFIAWLSKLTLQVIMVTHCNHANEIDAKVQNAIARLKKINIMVLNQSVLLKGVNDSVEALVALSESLFTNGVLPYYLHMLDFVMGTAHFAVEEHIAKALIKEMMGLVSGYLVPKLVREEPDARAKVPICCG